MPVYSDTLTRDSAVKYAKAWFDDTIPQPTTRVRWNQFRWLMEQMGALCVTERPRAAHRGLRKEKEKHQGYAKHKSGVVHPSSTIRTQTTSYQAHFTIWASSQTHHRPVLGRPWQSC
jgi:hypothetical protein